MDGFLECGTLAQFSVFEYFLRVAMLCLDKISAAMVIYGMRVKVGRDRRARGFNVCTVPPPPPQPPIIIHRAIRSLPRFR